MCVVIFPAIAKVDNYIKRGCKHVLLYEIIMQSISLKKIINPYLVVTQ